jgi:hypothetical protein
MLHAGQPLLGAWALRSMNISGQPRGTQIYKVIGVRQPAVAREQSAHPRGGSFEVESPIGRLGDEKIRGDAALAFGDDSKGLLEIRAAQDLPGR